MIDVFELPNAFLIPISFILVLATNRTNPNIPIEAINSVNRANMETIVLRFLIEE